MAGSPFAVTGNFLHKSHKERTQCRETEEIAISWTSLTVHTSVHIHGCRTRTKSCSRWTTGDYYTRPWLWISVCCGCCLGNRACCYMLRQTHHRDKRLASCWYTREFHLITVFVFEITEGCSLPFTLLNGRNLPNANFAFQSTMLAWQNRHTQRQASCHVPVVSEKELSICKSCTSQRWGLTMQWWSGRGGFPSMAATSTLSTNMIPQGPKFCTRNSF